TAHVQPPGLDRLGLWQILLRLEARRLRARVLPSAAPRSGAVGRALWRAAIVDPAGKQRVLGRRGVQARARGVAQLSLGARVHLGWERSQLGRELERARKHAIGLRQLVEDTQAKALIGADQLVAERERARGVRGELSGHDADRRLRVGNADLDLGEAVATFARGDADICA